MKIEPKKQQPERPFDNTAIESRDLRLLKQRCQEVLRTLDTQGHDTSPICMYLNRLELLHHTEFDRRCYLEGYAESLFVQLVCKDSK
jgi:hypothetical protein